MSLRIGNMRTSLVILNIDKGLAYLRESGEFEYGSNADQSVILNIDRGLAYLGVSGEFE